MKKFIPESNIRFFYSDFQLRRPAITITDLAYVLHCLFFCILEFARHFLICHISPGYLPPALVSSIFQNRHLRRYGMQVTEIDISRVVTFSIIAAVLLYYDVYVIISS